MCTGPVLPRCSRGLLLLLLSATLLLGGCATRLPPVPPPRCPEPPQMPPELNRDPIETPYLRSLLDASRTRNMSEPSSNGTEGPTE